MSIFFPTTEKPVYEKEYFVGPVTKNLMIDQFVDEDEEADDYQNLEE